MPMNSIVRTLIGTNPRVFKPSWVFQSCVLPEKLKHLCNEGCIVRQNPHIPRCVVSKMDECAAICDTQVKNCVCYTSNTERRPRAQ